jgi:hypothetical protein
MNSVLVMALLSSLHGRSSPAAAAPAGLVRLLASVVAPPSPLLGCPRRRHPLPSTPSRHFRPPQAGPESELAPLLGIVGRCHRVVGLEPKRSRYGAGVRSCWTARWRLRTFCGLPQTRQTRWSGRIERRTDTNGSEFSFAGCSGSAPSLLSWPATEVMSPPSSDGAILLLETYAETISALSSAVLRV